MKNLTVFTFLCFALVGAALAAPPAPSTSPLPQPAIAAGVTGCPSADLPAWLAQPLTPAPQPPTAGELPELLPKPAPRTATCNPERCALLHGVCECDQFGNCFCVPV